MLLLFVYLVSGLLVAATGLLAGIVQCILRLSSSASAPLGSVYMMESAASVGVGLVHLASYAVLPEDAAFQHLAPFLAGLAASFGSLVATAAAASTAPSSSRKSTAVAAVALWLAPGIAYGALRAILSPEAVHQVNATALDALRDKYHMPVEVVDNATLPEVLSIVHQVREIVQSAKLRPLEDTATTASEDASIYSILERLGASSRSSRSTAPSHDLLREFLMLFYVLWCFLPVVYGSVAYTRLKTAVASPSLARDIKHLRNSLVLAVLLHAPASVQLFDQAFISGQSGALLPLGNAYFLYRSFGNVKMVAKGKGAVSDEEQA